VDVEKTGRNTGKCTEKYRKIIGMCAKIYYRKIQENT
jgi:hypothetical protein